MNTYFKENNTSVPQGHIQLIKYDSKDFNNVIKDLFFEINAFLFTFYSSMNPERNASQFPEKYELFSTWYLE